MKKLLEESGSLGKPRWQPMLQYVAALHAKSTHSPRPPFVHAWEEIGTGYVSSPAFGHWDIVHQILDVLPAEPEHAHAQILNNLCCQEADGLVPGVIWLKSGEAKWDTDCGYPPVWPVAVEEWTQLQNSTELIERCFEPLTRQINWFETHRAATPHGFFYRDISDHRWESGVDEGVRFDDIKTGSFSCIDATSHLFQMYDIGARWAQVLGKDTAHFEKRAAELRDFIRHELWDEESGWFYDIWAVRDRAQRHLTFEGMWPLVVGAADNCQAQRVVESLIDPGKFFTPHPLASVAVSDPAFELRMWRGPAWNSMTMWAARGCARYGHDDAARMLVEHALDASAVQFEQSGTIWEFYHPFGGDPREVQRKPDTPWNEPCSDYLGHNPLIEMARMFDAVATVSVGGEEKFLTAHNASPEIYTALGRAREHKCPQRGA